MAYCIIFYLKSNGIALYNPSSTCRAVIMSQFYFVGGWGETETDLEFIVLRFKRMKLNYFFLKFLT